MYFVLMIIFQAFGKKVVQCQIFKNASRDKWVLKFGSPLCVEQNLSCTELHSSQDLPSVFEVRGVRCSNCCHLYFPPFN